MTLQQKIKNSAYVGLVSLIGIVGCEQSKTNSELNISSYERSPQGVISEYNFDNAYGGREKANLIQLNYKSNILGNVKMDVELEWPLVYDPKDQKLIMGVYSIEVGDSIKLDSEGYINEIKPGPNHIHIGHEVIL